MIERFKLSNCYIIKLNYISHKIGEMKKFGKIELDSSFVQPFEFIFMLETKCKFLKS